MKDLSPHSQTPRVRAASNADDQGDGSGAACDIAIQAANDDEMITIAE